MEGKKTGSIVSFCKSTEPAAEEPIQKQDSGLASYTTGKGALDAEILWAIKCVLSHFSYNSCQGNAELFSRMFPDSTIAKQFALGERKCSYLISFGLAPHIKSMLLKSLGDADFFTILFDETLNKSNQRKQMDIHLRFWDSSENQVKTKYFDSAFMGHSTAEDLLKEFYTIVKSLNLSKLLQISMDGPSVNWSFYNALQKDLEKEFNCVSANIGTCGLHILNNAFRKGASAADWNISSVLVSLFWLFKDSPARREDFLELSVLKKLPTKFCTYRWLENVPAAEKAVLIWDDIKSFVKSIEKGDLAKINNKSFNVVAEATKDKLFVLKMQFFASVAKALQPFMTKYQSDSPLLPFFADDIFQLVRNCLQLFNVLQPEVLSSINSIDKMVKFDFSDTKKYSGISKVSTGFVIEKSIKELLQRNVISTASVMAFRHECQQFIVKMIEKLMVKCPANYAFVRNASCLDPRLAENAPKCTSRFKRVLTYLSQIKKVKDENCDSILIEYNAFLEDEVKKFSNEFKEFDPSKNRLDAFLGIHLSVQKYTKVWEVIKIVLLFSHGQASVERGFSVNKAIEVENLKENSYVSQRLVYDYAKTYTHLHDLEITNDMRKSVSSARLKYEHYLEEQRQLQKTTSAQNKRKLVLEEVEFLKRKKFCIEHELSELEKTAEELAERAEASKDISLFIKSNNLRKTMREKNNEVLNLQAKIEDEKKKL